MNVRDHGTTLEIDKPTYTCRSCQKEMPVDIQMLQKVPQPQGGFDWHCGFNAPQGWVILAGLPGIEEPLVSCETCWPKVKRSVQAAFSPIIVPRLGLVDAGPH